MLFVEDDLDYMVVTIIVTDDDNVRRDEMDYLVLVP